jgi:tetraacyldisaccharide 4'-kinase
LPTGDLRDLKSEYKRAEIIVVTKCVPDLSETEKQSIITEIDPGPGQSVFFATMEYGQPYHILNNAGLSFTEDTEVLLVTGIANPRPLQSMLEKYSKTYHLLQYPDHRIFTIDDLKEIRKKFMALDSVEKIILTTEKDAVRLVKFNAEIADWPMYVIPVRHHFLYGEEVKFGQLVTDFINGFGQPQKN